MPPDPDTGEVDELADEPEERHEFLYGSTDNEIDQLDNSDGLDDDAGPSQAYLGEQFRKEWFKDVAPDVLARWAVGPPGFAQKRKKEVEARAKAKVRRQQKKTIQKPRKVAQQPPARGGKKPARQAAKPKGKTAMSMEDACRSESSLSDDSAAPEVDSTEEDEGDEENPRKRARVGPPPRKYTAYIHVERPPDVSQPPVPTLRSRFTGKVAAAATAPVVEQHGPIILHDNEPFTKFVTKLSTAVGCIASFLPLSDLYWRFEKPANNARKPLRCDLGYAAMLSALEERVKDRVVILQMPPPKRQTSYTGLRETQGVSGYALQPEHPYDDHIAAANPSVQEQMAGMNRRDESQLRQLEARYPINNVPHLFPGKRVYQRGEHHWELNNARLSVWASALAQGTCGVTTEMPPNSMHFAPKAAMRLPASVSIPGPQAQSHTPYTPYMANTFYHSSGPSYPHPGSSYPTPGYYPPMQAMSPFGMSAPPHYPAMMHPQAMQAHLTHPYMAPGGPGAMPPNAAPHGAAQHPPSNPLIAHHPYPTVPRARIPTKLAASSANSAVGDISVADFCSIFGLSDDIAFKLDMLGFSPGDQELEKMPFNRLQIAGLSFADWETVVAANSSLISNPGWTSM